MTVHMVRVYIGPDTAKLTLSQAKAAWATWLSKASEWTDDNTEHTLTEAEQMQTGETYWSGTGRFLLEDAKDNLLQKCEDKWVNKCAWYRIGYHECGFDRPDLSAEYDCEWSEPPREWTAKGVSIPAWVPEMGVPA